MGGTEVVIYGRDVGQGGEKTGKERKKGVLLRKGKPGKTSDCVLSSNRTLGGKGKSVFAVAINLRRSG